MRLHGADHNFTLTATVQPGAKRLEWETRFTIPCGQWGITNPSAFLLRVSEKLDMEFHATGKLSLGMATPD